MSRGSDELPWLELRTLSEFARCINAGRISFMRQGTDREQVPDRIPNLGYVPSFDYVLLLELSSELKAKLGKVFLFIIFVFAICIFIRISGQLGLALILLSCLLPGIYVFVRDMLLYREVQRKISAYDHALPKPLPESAVGPIAIHWWELVKSGFRPILTDSYSDTENRFGGRPWRLLIDQNSRQRIPVIQHFETFENQIKATEAYEMHLALCANLIELQEGPVQWGLVVDAKSLQGIAIPLTKESKKRAISFVNECQLRIRKSRERKLELPPENECRICPLAFPRRAGKPTFLGQESVPPFLFNSISFLPVESEDTGYEPQTNSFEKWMKSARFLPPNRHCDCGDIFKWKPLHAFWIRLRERDEERYRVWLARRN